MDYLLLFYLKQIFKKKSTSCYNKGGGWSFYLKQILKKRQKKSTLCYNEGGKFLIFGDSYAIAVAGVFFVARVYKVHLS